MREGTAHFDVVVTDQIMADGDGWDALRYAREYCKGLPVILVSGINPQRPDGLPDAVKFDASLRKPFALQDLVRALSGIRPAARAVRRPDADVLGNLLALVRLGEVSGIEEWSDQLEVQAPGYAAFATEVRQAVRQLDFDRLAVLAAPESPV
jgi:CheY-like chemotaxis protein